MDETYLTSRQRKILKLLNNRSLSRNQLQKLLTEKVSKPTLFRDLRTLISQDLVKSSGRGKATIYFKIDQNPLLGSVKKVSLGDNPIHFNFEVFDHLNNLLTSKEILYLDGIYKSIDSQIAKLGNTIAKRELERFVIDLAWKSSKIEGNTYSLLETEILIKSGQTPPGHTTEETAMILNHKTAFDTILTNRKDFKIINLSDITQLHNILIQNLNVEPGVRKHPVAITGSRYLPLDNQWQINEALDTLTVTLNSASHPFEKALIASCMIAYIQPFGDGNKRTSRMFANAILLAHDYYPLSYRAVSEIDYKKALISFYEQNSLVQLKKILIQQYEFVLDNYFRV